MCSKKLYIPWSIYCKFTILQVESIRLIFKKVPTISYFINEILRILFGLQGNKSTISNHVF